MLAGATSCPVIATSPSPTNIQTEAEGGSDQNTQPTDAPTSSNSNEGENQNVATIVGIVVTVILVTVLFTVAVILVIYIMQRRNCFSTKEDGLVNPSYDLGELIITNQRLEVDNWWIPNTTSLKFLCVFAAA